MDISLSSTEKAGYSKNISFQFIILSRFGMFVALGEKHSILFSADVVVMVF